MIGLDINLIGDKVVARALEASAKTAHQRANKVVAHWGHILEGRIKARAPVDTGDYRRSWNTQVKGMAALVGTNKPQARRLEFGFVGTDSLGRHYNQAPRPHVRPAIEEVRGPFLAAMSKALRA